MNPAAAIVPPVPAAAPAAAATLPLPLLPPGTPARIGRILESGHGVARNLSALGLVPGVRVTVLHAQGGPLLVRVGESRLALGRGLAQRILVIPGG